MGTQKDVTETKKSEKNLLESEALKSAILNSSLDAIITIDITDTVIEWNLSAERIFGYSGEEAIGQKMANLIIPERYREHHLRGMTHFLKTNEGPVLKKQIEILALRKDGTEFPSELYISPINIDGRILFTGTLRDITARKQAEKNLIESEKRFRDVADSAPVMIWMSDEKNETVYVNKTWNDFTGLDAEKLAGKTWSSIVHPEDVDRAVKEFKESFQQFAPITMIYRLRKKTGEYRWVLDTGIPRKLNDGSFIGYIGSVVDINDQKLKEDYQKQLTQATIDAQEEERKEIGKELHDNVGQLLATSKLYLELAKSTADNVTEEMISLSLKSVSDVINEVRQISHSLIPPTLGDLGLIDSIKDLIETFTRTQPLEIQFEHPFFDEDLLPENQKLMLFRIIQEQLNNIVKHANATVVFITLRNVRPLLLLEIQDDGKGFDAKRVRKGIGLANIKNRAELFGGKMEIISASGKGCIIKVMVPQVLH